MVVDQAVPQRRTAMITEIALFKLPAGMSREEYSNWIPLSDHLHRVKTPSY